VILFGIFSLIIVLAILAIVPKTNETLKRRKRVVIILSAAYLAFWFLHPYIFGLRGLIGGLAFERHIRKGMTRSEVMGLATKYQGTGLGGEPLVRDENPDDDFLAVYFVNFATLCVMGGKEFELNFSKERTLTSWGTEPWGSAC